MCVCVLWPFAAYMSRERGGGSRAGGGWWGGGRAGRGREEERGH